LGVFDEEEITRLKVNKVEKYMEYSRSLGKLETKV